VQNHLFIGNKQKKYEFFVTSPQQQVATPENCKNKYIFFAKTGVCRI